MDHKYNLGQYVEVLGFTQCCLIVEVRLSLNGVSYLLYNGQYFTNFVGTFDENDIVGVVE